MTKSTGESGDIFCQAVRDMNLWRRNIEMIKKLLMHEPAVGGGMVRAKADILIQIERGDGAKIEMGFAVQAD